MRENDKNKCESKIDVSKYEERLASRHLSFMCFPTVFLLLVFFISPVSFLYLLF